MRIWTRKSILIQPRTSPGKSDCVVANRWLAATGPSWWTSTAGGPSSRASGARSSARRPARPGAATPAQRLRCAAPLDHKSLANFSEFCQRLSNFHMFCIQFSMFQYFPLLFFEIYTKKKVHEVKSKFRDFCF